MEPVNKSAGGDISGLAQHLAEADAALNRLRQQCRQDGNDQLEAAIDQALAAVHQARQGLADRETGREPSGYTPDEIEQLFTAIFESSPYALSLASMPEGTLVMVNEAYLDLFGFTRQEVIGKTSVEVEITNADSHALMAEEFQKSGSLHNFEVSRSTKTGKLLNLSISLDWVNVGSDNYLLTTIHDQTSHKQTERALEASHLEALSDRQRLLRVMDTIPIGVGILDARGVNMQVNRHFEVIWGGPRPQISGVFDYSAMHAWWADSNLPVQPEEWASAQAIHKGITVTGQVLKIQRLDGAIAYIHNNAAPIFDAHGEISGCVVAIQEITELKQHEDEIRRLNRTLRALSNSNQAMLHAVDEQELLNKTC